MSENINHRDEFDAILNRSFVEQAVEADAAVWNNIEAALASNKKRIAAWWWYGAAASFALIISAIGFFSESQNPELSTNNEVEVMDVNQNDNSNIDQIEMANTSSEVEPRANENQASELEIGKENNLKKQFEPQLTESDKGKGQEFKAQKTIRILLAAESSEISSDAAINSENNAVFDKIIAIEKSSKTDFLDKMPTLLASLEIESARQEFEKRHFPQFVDDFGNSEAPYSDGFLAANLSSSAGANQSGSSSNSFGFGDMVTSGANEEIGIPDFYRTVDVNTEYQAPFVIGAKAAVALSKRWLLESGLVYSRLGKSFSSESAAFEPFNVIDHYIGIHLFLDFELIRKKHFSLILSTGAQLDKGIASRKRENFSGNGVGITHLSTPGIQVGYVFGFSTEYRFTNQLGLYAQPSVTYWMYSSQGVDNVRSNAPVWPSLQVGLRYRIK